MCVRIFCTLQLSDALLQCEEVGDLLRDEKKKTSGMAFEFQSGSAFFPGPFVVVRDSKKKYLDNSGVWTV